jgi:hypothetical protein
MQLLGKLNTVKKYLQSKKNYYINGRCKENRLLLTTI